MSDKHIIYSVVKQSDFFYETCKLHPNTITLFNNLVITPILLYYLYCNYYFITLLFVWIRAYLDGLDGYIARKYDKTSKVGEIYDHFSDCLYVGTMTSLLLLKINYVDSYAFSIGYISSVVAVVCDYDERYHFIARFAGAGGNQDGYSFLLPFIFVSFSWSLYLLGFID